MEELRTLRNHVEDLCYRDLPEGLYPSSQRAEDAANRVAKIEQLMTQDVSSRSIQEQVFQQLVDFITFQENSDFYFAAELRLIKLFFAFLFGPQGEQLTSARFLKYVVSAKELLRHQRRRLDGKPALDLPWCPVVDRMISVYADGLREGYIPSASSIERSEQIEELSKFLKELIYFQPADADKELVNFVMSNFLKNVDLQDTSAIDTVDLAFSILSCIGGDTVATFLSESESILWTFFEALQRNSPLWFQPRLELQYLSVIGKLEPKHWSQSGVKEKLIHSGILKKLLSYGFDFIGIPSSATTASPDTTSAIETSNLYKQSGALISGDKRRVMGKVARIAVSLVWSQDESAAQQLGWRFIELVSIRTQAVLLPSVLMAGKRGGASSGEAARWPFRLSDLYTSLAHHWLRRKMRSDFAPVSGDHATVDHERFVNFLLPGVYNVMDNTFGGGVGPSIATKYVSVFVNLARIAPGINHDISPSDPLVLATETLSDVHKSIVHAVLMFSGLTPLAGHIAKLGSDNVANTLTFLLDHAIESLDTTNLVKTISVMGFLDVLYTQAPHGMTLRDLSSARGSGHLLTLSTAFPDWSFRFLERLLVICSNLPKPKALTAVAVSALSSEGLEVIGRALVKKLFTWIVSNVDTSVLKRFTDLFRDFLTAEWSNLVERGRIGLIGNLLSALMKVRFDSDLMRWVISKINLSDINARGNTVWISLIGHAVRFSGNHVLSFLPRVNEIITTVLGNSASSQDLKKVSIKVIQRVMESVCQYYNVEDRSYDAATFSNTQFLMDRFGKSPTAVSESWWSKAGSVEMYIPITADVDTAVAFARGLLNTHGGANMQMNLRIATAITRGMTDSVILGETSSAIALRNELLESLAAMSNTVVGDVKSTNLWLKASRHILPSPVEGDEDNGLNALIHEMSGFKIENLQEFAFVGKEFEILDETRYEYIGSKLLGLIDGVKEDRLNKRGFNDIELGIVKNITDLLLTSQFDKIKVGAVICLKGMIEISGVGATRDALLEVIVDRMMTHVRSTGQDRHVAKGMALLLNFCHEVGKFIMASPQRTVDLFNLIGTHLSSAACLDPEVMEALIGLFRDMWNDRSRALYSLSMTRPESDIASQYIRNIFGDLLSRPDLHWKTQTVAMCMAYYLWRYECTPSSEMVKFILGHLEMHLARGDATPLAFAMRSFIVFWIQILLVVDSSTVRHTIAVDTVTRVAKVFSLNKRLDRGSSFARANDIVESVTGQIVSDEMQSNMFSNVKIPKLSNRGIAESNVVFWWFFMGGNCTERRTRITSNLIDLITPETVNDDDFHCTVLELYAAIIPNMEEAEWGRFFEFLKSEIARGDGSLVPTIATAIRIGITGLGQRSIVPPTGVEAQLIKAVCLAERLFGFLCSEITGCSDTGDSSMMNSRLLSVLNSCVLIDFFLLKRIDLAVFKQYLMDRLVAASTNEQVREIASSALARMVLVEGLDSSTESMIKSRVSDLSNDVLAQRTSLLGEESLDDEESSNIEEKVALVKLVTRLVKYRRGLPEWYRTIVHVALECVGNAKDEVKAEGSKFFSLVTRFISLEHALEIATDSSLHVHNPKEKEALIDLVVNAAVNGVTKPTSVLWTCAREEVPELIISQFIRPVNAAFFVQHVHSPIRIDEATNPIAITACKDGLTDLYILCPSVMLDSKILRCIDRPSSVSGLLDLSALVVLSSLFYDVPPWGIEAIGKLAHVISRDISPNVKRIGQTALAEFLKTQTDRGTREKTERMFDTDVLSLVRSSKSRHSYIS